jgi:hypothetical protein
LREAHKDAEELQEDEVHGVPDVEHEMKKVTLQDSTSPRSSSKYHLDLDAAELLSAHVESILGGKRGVLNLRGNNGVV